MLTMRQRISAIIAGVLLIVVIILLVIWFLHTNKKSPAVDQVSQPVSAPVREPVRTQPEVVAEELPPAEQNELVARQLARDFVERFRSFSNQNENAHIASVLPFVAPSMEQYVRRQSTEQRGEYEGMTTKVLGSNIKTYTDTVAEVAVSVQERRFSGGMDESVYRTGTVKLTKIDGSWYVSGLFWDADSALTQ